MKLVVGLGNPGEEYQNSRHNVGFLVLDHLLKELEPREKTFFEQERKLKTEVKKVLIEKEPVVLAKPQTFMNNSGTAVAKLLSWYKCNPQDLFVIHDDLDLPLGKIRIRVGGAAGGHRGVESIIEKIGTDVFLRIRLGIGRPMMIEDKSKKGHRSVEEYVLSNFTAQEKGKVRTMLTQSYRDIKILLKDGIDLYMSKYNKK